MANCKMPGGKPIWHANLEDVKLSDMFGFVQALIVVPKNTHKPFLPKRDPEVNSLKFPDGIICGVYFTEEFKYAETLGYVVSVACGYLFEPMGTPFKSYVDDLYNRRLKAKKDGDKVAAFQYKILLK